MSEWVQSNAFVQSFSTVKLNTAVGELLYSKMSKCTFKARLVNIHEVCACI